MDILIIYLIFSYLVGMGMIAEANKVTILDLTEKVSAFIFMPILLPIVIGIKMFEN